MLNAVATAMETHDPFILGAMEGMDDVTAASSARRNAGPEPTAMFFVIFGLVYEALSSSAPYSESTTAASGHMPLIALRAMKCLVRREYSGRALLEPTIFDELLNLWYRIAMTEPPALQAQLMDVIRVFATEQCQGTNPFVTHSRRSMPRMLTLVTVRMTLHRRRWFVCESAHIYLRMPFLVLKDLPVVRFLRLISLTKPLDAAIQITSLILLTGSHSSKRLSLPYCPSARPLMPRFRKKSVLWQYRYIAVRVPIYLTSLLF